ncbi:hypothetical protein F8M41_004648 [Gigaspora margarita]|uniref:Uncharacterized protein n=1 Tax=Gigaspora margarita TaxID=4874 RepID=A0A8H3X9F2_GIGMA|nr:hypothetical protein F8M41_004648 [Gigaspora margarita]
MFVSLRRFQRAQNHQNPITGSQNNALSNNDAPRRREGLVRLMSNQSFPPLGVSLFDSALFCDPVIDLGSLESSQRDEHFGSKIILNGPINQKLFSFKVF